MKIHYKTGLKQLVLDGEGDLIIPRQGCAFNIDSESLKMLNEKHDVTLSVQNFYYQGKPSFKEKLKSIWKIIKL